MILLLMWNDLLSKLTYRMMIYPLFISLMFYFTCVLRISLASQFQLCNLCGNAYALAQMCIEPRSVFTIFFFFPYISQLHLQGGL
jgi:hypothetical protein